MRPPLREALAYAPVLAVLLLLYSDCAAAGALTWTGDEPRYCYQALGLLTSGLTSPSATVWHDFAVRSGFAATPAAYGVPPHPTNSVVVSLLYAPALLFGNLDIARWQSFVFVCIGIVALYAAVRTATPGTHGERIAYATTAAALIAASVPLTAYARVLYPEAPLFALTAVALFGFATKRLRLAIAVAVLLPFVHIRALPLAVALVAIATLDPAFRPGGRARVLLGASFAAGIGAFAVFQIAVYGSLGGTAFSGYPVTLATIPERLGMQLFDARHGIIAYWPPAIVGIAGLIAGTVRRDAFWRANAILCSTYAATFLWATASESWTARYWVAALPMLAAGIAAWLSLARTLVARLAALALVAVAYVNIRLFTSAPVTFLENRRGSASYAVLAMKSRFDPGIFLPIDSATEPNALPAFLQPIPSVLLFGAIAVAAFTSLALGRSRRARAFGGAATFSLLFATLAICYLPPIPAGSVSSTRSADRRSISFDVRGGAFPIRGLRFDSLPAALWSRPRFPAYFEVSCTVGSTTVRDFTTPSRFELLISGCPATATIRVAATDPTSLPLFREPVSYTLLMGPVGDL